MSMGSNGITIRNGYFFGDSHDKRALETLKENGNALIPNFERFFSSIPPEESLNGNVQRPDYEAFSPIPPEYSLDANRNFSLFECEELHSQLPIEYSIEEIEEFFQEALENLDKIDIDHLSGLQELTAVILISKEHYEKHEEFTKELIDNLFKKIVEKLEINKKSFYEDYLKKLEIKKMDINENVQSYVKLLLENLEFVFTFDRSRYETFKSQCDIGYDEFRNSTNLKKIEIQRKIIQINNLYQHGNVLDFLKFLYERTSPYIPEEKAIEVVEFIYDYHVKNFKVF